uniref:histone-lysine N-methyltransferase SETDB1-A-like isoform X2 n=1 Tax=Doryrhamphus excisus TaxID=161450 RepID=UPI0025AE4F1C|nr:histone-lysine N-methyltransferase SETDB1-A-like isoform X2 [Doryrhamphus excisus]
MEGDEMEMTKEELQSWISERVQNIGVISPEVLEKCSLLRSLLDRRKKLAERLLKLCKSVAECEVIVKEQYALLGWEYKETYTSDSDDDNVYEIGSSPCDSETPIPRSPSWCNISLNDNETSVPTQSEADLTRRKVQDLPQQSPGDHRSKQDCLSPFLSDLGHYSMESSSSKRRRLMKETPSDNAVESNISSPETSRLEKDFVSKTKEHRKTEIKDAESDTSKMKKAENDPVRMNSQVSEEDAYCTAESGTASKTTEKRKQAENDTSMKKEKRHPENDTASMAKETKIVPSNTVDKEKRKLAETDTTRKRRKEANEPAENDTASKTGEKGQLAENEPQVKQNPAENDINKLNKKRKQTESDPGKMKRAENNTSNAKEGSENGTASSTMEKRKQAENVTSMKKEKIHPENDTASKAKETKIVPSNTVNKEKRQLAETDTTSNAKETRKQAENDTSMKNEKRHPENDTASKVKETKIVPSNAVDKVKRQPAETAATSKAKETRKQAENDTASKAKETNIVPSNTVDKEKRQLAETDTTSKANETRKRRKDANEPAENDTASKTKEKGQLAENEPQEKQNPAENDISKMSEKRKQTESDPGKMKRAENNTSNTKEVKNDTASKTKETRTPPENDTASKIMERRLAAQNVEAAVAISSLDQSSKMSSKIPIKVLDIEITEKMKVLAKKSSLCWQRGKVRRIIKMDNVFKYKVKLDQKGKCIVPAHHLAMDGTPTVDYLYIGARVVVGGKDEVHFRPGILAELPSKKNHHRFLVFVDDQVPIYVGLCYLHLVCTPLPDPLDDIADASHRDFIRFYLKVWPCPPQTQYKVGQSFQVDLNGVQQNCTVQLIDCSLMQVVFAESQRKRWIYRGSLCLEPIRRMKKFYEMKSTIR